jgi:hypothetical protein
MLDGESGASAFRVLAEDRISTSVTVDERPQNWLIRPFDQWIHSDMGRWRLSWSCSASAERFPEKDAARLELDLSFDLSEQRQPDA